MNELAYGLVLLVMIGVFTFVIMGLMTFFTSDRFLLWVKIPFGIITLIAFIYLLGYVALHG